MWPQIIDAIADKAPLTKPRYLLWFATPHQDERGRRRFQRRPAGRDETDAVSLNTGF
jgi:hypothetical protein